MGVEHAPRRGPGSWLGSGRMEKGGVVVDGALLQGCRERCGVAHGGVPRVTLLIFWFLAPDVRVPMAPDT